MLPRSVAAVVARLTDLLGEPVATPEMVTGSDGEPRLARDRKFMWTCPRCMAGSEPVDLHPCSRDYGMPGSECDCGDQFCLVLLAQLFPYRPFTVTSDGAVFCAACRGTEEQLAAALKLLDV